ncbi:MAG TPA: molybdenum cofactor guanylyltransferase [Pyrinomonadaceae bacterium]|nr:molybdenum cofactor guanylyltransferase [Pyrinomonadaceae bacterium]
MKDTEAFILAGGASSRMGTDKSQLLIDRQTFAERIAETLLKVTDSVTVVGRPLDGLNLPSVPDVYPQWGALGGLHAALAACRRDWAIIVACDLPFVTAELFQSLSSLRLDHEAVVPIQPDGRPQPLAALYRVDPCRQRATELIEAGRRRPADLLEAVDTRWVSFDEIRNLEQAEKFFVNINTPSDYYEATRGYSR